MRLHASSEQDRLAQCLQVYGFLRNSNTIYGKKLKNTEEKHARDGVASITTSGGFKRATEKLRKSDAKYGKFVRTTVKFSWRLC